jgi:hypothetical protein
MEVVWRVRFDGAHRPDRATLHSMRHDDEADIRQTVQERLDTLEPTSNALGELHG